MASRLGSQPTDSGSAAPTNGSLNSVRSIVSRSVAEQVTTELRRSILCGDLPPGESLSLRRLADVLGVSFIPVRDALKVLEADGLIVNPPGRSATVAPVDLAELHSIYRIRKVLEPDLARAACITLSDDELDRLHAAAAELGRFDLSMDDTYEDHNAFHMALLQPAVTVWDARILNMLWRAAERYVRVGFGLMDPDPNEHIRRKEAHQYLVAEFRKRDPDAAARALEEHLARNENLADAALANYSS